MISKQEEIRWKSCNGKNALIIHLLAATRSWLRQESASKISEWRPVKTLLLYSRKHFALRSRIIYVPRNSATTLATLWILYNGLQEKELFASILEGPGTLAGRIVTWVSCFCLQKTRAVLEYIREFEFNLFRCASVLVLLRWDFFDVDVGKMMLVLVLACSFPRFWRSVLHDEHDEASLLTI